MIGYYISCSEEVCDIFKPYVWDKHGLDTLMKNKLAGDYGNDMELLLIQYYVEGKFSNYLPAQPKLGNYMKKSRDIVVAIGVPRESFHDRNEFERREFIVDSTLNAIKLVKERLIKKKLDVDFDKLTKDVREVSREYLEWPEPYV
jgi:hypothetical protein